jgi:AcrR family transcriptional regulator
MSDHSFSCAETKPLTTSRAERNRILRDERHAEIVAQALRLFAERGYAETTVRMIAEAVGMSQGLLYRYFPSKEQLLVAIFEESVRDVRASFAAADAGADPAEKVERLVRGAFAILRQHLTFWRLSYSVRMQPAVLGGLGDRLLTWTDEIRQKLEGYLRELGAAEPPVEAAILFALIDGVSQHYALDPAGYPLDAVADAIARRYKMQR